MEKILIFDFNNLLYKSVHVGKNIIFNEKVVGGLYTFVTSLAKKINDVKPNYILFCTDSPPYKRSEDFSAYKSDRIKDAEFSKKLQESREYCTDFLALLHINIFRVKGFEADDLIAYLCKHYTDYEKIIVSSDTDFFQLFKHNNVKLLRGDTFYTHEDFKSEYPNLSFEDFEWVLALAGTHNGIPGIPRIGIKTAIKIVKDVQRFAQLMSDKEVFDKVSLYRSLVKLPYKSEIFSIPPLTYAFNRVQIIQYLNRFGIELTNNMFDAFSII